MLWIYFSKFKIELRLYIRQYHLIVFNYDSNFFFKSRIILTFFLSAHSSPIPHLSLMMLLSLTTSHWVHHLPLLHLPYSPPILFKYSSLLLSLFLPKTSLPLCCRGTLVLEEILNINSPHHLFTQSFSEEILNTISLPQLIHTISLLTS